MNLQKVITEMVKRKGPKTKQTCAEEWGVLFWVRRSDEGRSAVKYLGLCATPSS
jgi:hypothetical protein